MFFSDYKKIQPRVDCRWLDGTPKLRKSSADIPAEPVKADQARKTGRLHMRRSSESDLRNIQLRPRIRVQAPSSNSASSASEVDESDSDSEQLFKTAEGSVEEAINVSEHSNFEENISATSGTSIETVSDHFRCLFMQLEDYMKTADDEKERIAIRKRMNKMKHQMKQINIMFEGLLNDGDRLEKYLMDGNNNNKQA